MFYQVRPEFMKCTSQAFKLYCAGSMSGTVGFTISFMFPNSDQIPGELFSEMNRILASFLLNWKYLHNYTPYVVIPDLTMPYYLRSFLNTLFNQLISQAISLLYASNRTRLPGLQVGEAATSSSDLRLFRFLPFPVVHEDGGNSTPSMAPPESAEPLVQAFMKSLLGSSNMLDQERFLSS